MTNPTFVMSADARLILQHLKAQPVGSTVTYADLSKVVGRKVTSTESALHTARRRLIADHSIVYASVRSVGIKRLSDSEIVQSSDADVDSIRRKARRGVRKITAISDYTALSSKEQIAHTARLSVFGAVAAMTTDSAVKKIETAAVGRTSELPIAETLRVFAA